ncbi:hypothetical protein [Streptomyces sp. OV198]|jgi:hypothetical protein|uniref:hypothetical protein n=1 Tax=Streptomyces sp. OV198 TaxID=1882787 RepID=UPI0015CF6743|nr:hypothetical protein [Streptomyces sp. OV198]
MLTPDRAGLPADGRTRRVPGLRRDEVARLVAYVWSRQERRGRALSENEARPGVE